MTEGKREKLRHQIEKEAMENDWSWFRVTVTAQETGKSETLEVPGRDARHASRVNAMFLLEMRLRGETVEYEVEPIVSD
jgi:hypothetical protein